MRCRTTSLSLALAWLPVLANSGCSNFYQPVSDRIQSESGAQLSQTLRTLLQGTHQFRTYNEAWEILKRADAANGDPFSGQVFLIYSNETHPKDDTNGNGVTGGRWNREHTWPNSFGLLDEGEDYTDLHNLRPCDSSVNSARSNKVFDNCFESQGCRVPATNGLPADTGSDANVWMPPAISRGDVARSILYMALRYDGSANSGSTLDLALTDCPIEANSASAKGSKRFMGRLSTLLEWHQADLPSSREEYRNDVVCSEQGNRNPFVDFPELAQKVFGPEYVDPICPSSLAPASSSAVPSVAPSVAPSAAPSAAKKDEGSIAIIGVNADDTERVALVALNNLPAGYEFTMTDNGVLQDGITFRQGEGSVFFSAPTQIAKGTVLVWEQSGIGSSPGFATASARFALSTTQDSLIVFKGAREAPEFLYAANIGSGPGWALPGTAMGSQVSYLPEGMEASNVVLGSANNWRYVGPQAGTKAVLKSAIGNSSNWQAEKLDFDPLTWDFKVDSPNLNQNPEQQRAQDLTAILAASAGGLIIIGALVLLVVKKRSRAANAKLDPTSRH